MMHHQTTISKNQSDQFVDVVMKAEAVMMNVDSDVPRALVRRIDCVNLCWKTTMMRRQGYRFTDIAMRVPRIMIVAVLAVDNMVVEE